MLSCWSRALSTGGGMGQEFLGVLDVELGDGTTLDVTVRKDGGSIYLSWQFANGEPVEHLVHPSQERRGEEGWLMELRHVLKTSVRKRLYTPAHLLGGRTPRQQ